MGYMRYEPSDYQADMIVRNARRRRREKHAAMAAILGLILFVLSGSSLCACL